MWAAAMVPGGLAAGKHDVFVNSVRLWYRVADDAPADPPPAVFLRGRFGAVPTLEYPARYPDHVPRMIIAVGLSIGHVGDDPSRLRAAPRDLPRHRPRRRLRRRAHRANVCTLFGVIPNQDSGRRSRPNIFSARETERPVKLHDTLGGLRNTGE